MKQDSGWYNKNTENMYNQDRTYNKTHRFFERMLNNDTDKLARFLKNEYKKIERVELKGIKPINEQEDIWLDSGSISTVKWKEYNVFQFYSDEIYDLLLNIKDATIEACEYYGIDFYKEKYHVQGWFNINQKDSGKLDWHDHGGPWAPWFHGYYCVNAEPSVTYYKIDNDDNQIIENININNRLIVSEMGHPHAQGDWNWDGDRITIAYDIVPMRFIRPFNQPQHWVPLT
jgi:hypothetical protein